jgi:hypothetical protein
MDGLGCLCCSAYLLLGVAGIVLVLAGLYRLGRSFLPGRLTRVFWSPSFVPYDSSVRRQDRMDGLRLSVAGGALLGFLYLFTWLVIAPLFEAID